MEKEAGNTELAKGYIRRAVRAELGKNVTGNNTELFLQAEKPHKVIHTAFEGSQVVQLLTAMGEEELLAVAKEEFEK